MLPEIETFQAAQQAAAGLHREAIKKTEIDCNNNRITYEIYRDTVRPLETERREAQEKARTEFREAMEARRGSTELVDRQAVFILDTCYDGYPDESFQVWGILPATGEEFRALSQRNSWCAVFRSFYEKAEEAGVIPGIDPLDPVQKARRALDRWLNTQYSYENTKQEVRDLVNAIVAAELGQAAAPQDAEPVDAS